MPRLTPDPKHWHPGQLLKPTPFGILLRRSQVIVSGQMAAHLKARKQAKPLTSSLAVERPAIAVGQPTGNFKVETPSTPAIVPETSGEEETEASEQEQEQVLTIDGKVVTPEEQSSLVKFFNDPSKRSVALSINYIGSKTMDNLESKRPLTWDVLVDSLSQIQLESAMKWLRSHPNYT